MLGVDETLYTPALFSGLEGGAWGIRAHDDVLMAASFTGDVVVRGASGASVVGDLSSIDRATPWCRFPSPRRVRQWSTIIVHQSDRLTACSLGGRSLAADSYIGSEAVDG